MITLLLTLRLSLLVPHKRKNLVLLHLQCLQVAKCTKSPHLANLHANPGTLLFSQGGVAAFLWHLRLESEDLTPVHLA